MKFPKPNLIHILQILFLIISFILAFKPIKKPLIGKRTILSTISGYLSPKLPFMKILKIQENDNYILEVYKKDESGSFTFLNRVPLVNSLYDSQIDVNGITTNLLLSDVDKDSELEVLVPIIDKDFTPRLRIFSYNHQLEELIPFTRN
jgi:hypothetical protein